MFRGLVSSILAARDYDVTPAATGDEALSLSRSGQFDLAVVDVGLPDRSGIEVAGGLGGLPVLFLTHSADVSTMRHALRESAASQNAVGYIIKPLAPESIEPTIRGALFAAQELRFQHRMIRAVAESVEHEKRILAKDMHDELGSSLTAMKLDVLGIHSFVETMPDSQRVTEATDRLLRHIDRLFRVTHNWIEELRPEVLENFPLSKALKLLIQDWDAGNPQCHYHVDIHSTIDAVPDALATTVYRILQEGLTNIARHAQASSVDLAVWRSESGAVCLSLSDNGSGFDPSPTSPNGRGLKGVRERVAAWGGNITLNSAPQQGTTLVVCIPVAVDGTSS